MNAAEYILQEVTDLASGQVESILRLVEQGATIPFIARYRKEQTSGADEEQIEKVVENYQQYQRIETRKKSVLKLIDEQEQLDEELRQKINQCFDAQELEDLYLPYKKKRQTRGEKAKKKGLEGLAKIIMAQKGEVENRAEKFVQPPVKDKEEAINGALDIVAEWANEHSATRKKIRGFMWREGYLESACAKGQEVKAEKYKDYFNFSEPVKKIPSHRYLAITRGEKEGLLKVKISLDIERAFTAIKRYFIKNDPGDYIEKALTDSLKRLIIPSTATQIRAQLKEQSDSSAIQIFTENLKQLLMTPPVGHKRTLAIDPGFQSGCKVICLDEYGNFLHNETIFPHPPKKDIATAKNKMRNLCDTFKIDAIAIGDGTAGRETESFVKSVNFSREVQVFVVSEDGASIYSASPLARKEFPQYDVTVRGAISIGRRMMDPLSELVKIDPQSLGIGQYQHDVNEQDLTSQLNRTAESVVNKVGVALNVASPQLLQHVAGIGGSLAKNIVAHREKNGAFPDRKSLKKVSGLGDKAFEQAAGFLRIHKGKNPLDASAVHPERYALLHKIAKANQKSIEHLINNPEAVESIDWEKFTSDEVGTYTLNDLKKELKKPGRDPRKRAKILEFDPRIKKIEDVQPGMQINGIIGNVTHFGAFVNIGIKENALIHISELADRYISDPMEIVKLHEHITLKILSVDIKRKRIQGSLKQVD